MSISSSNTLLFSLLDKYNFSANEREEFLSLVESIFFHDEFQKRMTKEFMHHDEVTLGEHIIEVTIYTYLLSKKYGNKKNFDLNKAVKIAMFHDLYSQPWQNNPYSGVSRRSNKHAFRHPIEAVINSSVWFPEIFDTKEDIKVITDGIVHHMFPLPVARLNDSNYNLLELRNFDYMEKMNSSVKESLITSCNKSAMGHVSLTPSSFSEGKIVSSADKIVSLNNLRGCNVNALLALITGKNDNLEEAKVKVLTNEQFKF